MLLSTKRMNLTKRPSWHQASQKFAGTCLIQIYAGIWSKDWRRHLADERWSNYLLVARDSSFSFFDAIMTTIQRTVGKLVLTNTWIQAFLWNHSWAVLWSNQLYWSVFFASKESMPLFLSIN